MNNTANIKIINEFAKARDFSFLFEGAVWAYESTSTSSSSSGGMPRGSF
jgi:hypothetical protein